MNVNREEWVSPMISDNHGSQRRGKSETKRRLIENDNLYKRVMALYEEGRQKDKEVFVTISD